MTDAFLLELEQAAWRVAQQVWPDLVSQQKLIRRAIQELSTIYNSERPIAAAVPDSPEHRLARLLFFTLADTPKVTFPLAELSSRGQLPSGAVRVLDVGCGFGSMVLGLLDVLKHQGDCSSLQVDAVDRDDVALATLPRILAELRGDPEVAIRTHHADLAHDPRLTGPYDLILAGNVFNELSPARAQPLALELLRKLAPAGSLIIVEPALRSTGRQLLTLRDRLLAEHHAHVFAPCTCQTPCPALVMAQDWCHESRNWTPPPELRRLAAATHLRRKDIKWSYLTLNHSGVNIADGDLALTRAVSAPLKSKGKREIYLCGSRGRHKVALLNRHRSSANERFREIQRGYLVRLPDPAGEAPSSRVGQETVVKIEDPASER